MDALLNVPAPSHNLVNLQSFHNTIQMNMRALSALDQPPEYYGALLTYVILNKLAPEPKINMAHDHYDSQWTIDELQTSIQRK